MDSLPEIPLRRCSKCGNEFPATTEYFYKAGKWLRPECICCSREYRRNYNKTHLEGSRIRLQRWRNRHPEENRERSRRYKSNNLEKVRESSRRYHRENREKERLYQRRRYKQFPEMARAKFHRRRLREQSSGEHFTASDIRLQIKAQTDKKGRLRCWWCGKVVKGSYHIDHVIPLDKGGSNGANNIVISCPRDNDSKGTKTIFEWRGRLL